jgi:ATP-dependent DNA helicase DinG
VRFILLDFETTGLDPADSELLEIGAILVNEKLEELARFQKLIRPIGDIPDPIVRLTGITPDLVENEPALQDIVEEFVDFCEHGSIPFVSHNSSIEQRFLDQFIAPFFPDDKQPFVHNSIEPMALLLAEQSSHSMESLRKWAGVTLEGSHRALEDCEALLEILRFGRTQLEGPRARVRDIATTFLGSQLGDVAWWWAWYFEKEEAPATLIEDRMDRARKALESREYGDLRELRNQDGEKDESPKPIRIPASDITQALHGERLSEGSFTWRAQQEAMSQAIREGFEKGERLAIEAPTGTGKSVAYLVPGILAARASETPLVVSTHSKALQDQLLEKDTPLVRKLLGDESIRITTVKGQENYLCLRKLMELVESTTGSTSLDERWSTAYLVAFAAMSDTGELDRVSTYIKNAFNSLPEQVDWIRSQHLTTLGPPCPWYKQCRFFNSARRAHQAQVVIANHSLVANWPAHLPKIRNIVFDEAHHLEDQLTDAYSVKLTESALAETLDRFQKKRGARGHSGDSAQIARFVRDLKLPPPWHNLDDVDATFGLQTEKIRSRLTQLRALAPLAIQGDRDSAEGYDEPIDLLPGGYIPKPVQALREGFQNLHHTVQDLANLLNAALEACATASASNDKRVFVDPATLDLLKTHAFRFDTAAKKLQTLVADDPVISPGEPASGNITPPASDLPSPPPVANWLRLVFWNGREATWRFHVAPIQVAPLALPFHASKRSIVLTSATLSAGTRTDFVTARIGLELSKPLLQLPSPYALEKQAAAFIPRGTPIPGSPAHLDTLVQFTEQVARSLEGRTLLLITSNRRLRIAAERLRERLTPHGITVIDSISDRRAADTFRATERALLIGSERYGEGLDIPGQQLACVIVEKINEAMTRSPLAEARKKRTKSPLFEYDFPLRMMWLRQRVGRLIRSTADRGAVVVWDARFHNWGAASREQVIRTLAPIPLRTGTPDELLEQIEALEI